MPGCQPRQVSATRPCIAHQRLLAFKLLASMVHRLCANPRPLGTTRILYQISDETGSLLTSVSFAPTGPVALFRLRDGDVLSRTQTLCRMGSSFTFRGVVRSAEKRGHNGLVG